MVIGFDGSRAFINDRTGTENYSYQLLKHLAKIDIENNYIIYVRSTFKDHLIYKPVNQVNQLTDSPFQLSAWPTNFQFKIINMPMLWTQIGLASATFKDKIDLLFVPAHTLPLIHRGGLKTVVTVHDLGAEYLPSMHQLKQRIYLKAMTYLQLKLATKIIAVSQATKNDLIKKVQLPSEKIEVVYEGVDQDFFYKQRGDSLSDVLNHLDLEKEKYFLFVGTIQPRKNLMRLIEAFSLLCKDPNFSGTNLVLAGSQGWLSKDLYKFPQKLGVEKRVRFLGRVDDKDLPSLYSGALALTFPSLFEGFGLPVLEAMSCGCPVITSKISSLPEVTGQAAILVDPYHVEEIANGMKQMLNSSLRGKLIKEGFKQSKKFTWQLCALKTLEVFKKADKK